MERIIVVAVVLVLLFLYYKPTEAFVNYPTKKTVVTPHYVHLGTQQCMSVFNNE